MAPKYTSKFGRRSQKKKRSRNVLSLHEKMIILEEIEKGRTYASIAREYGCNESSVRTIKKCELKIKNSIKLVTNPMTAKSTFLSRRDPFIEKMEQLLNVWIEDQTNKNVPLNSNIIRSKGLSIYNHIKSQAPLENSVESTFRATKGWFNRFRKRANLNHLVDKSEADSHVVDEFPTTLRNIIEEGGYHPEQVFNCDVTELFWRRMHNRIFIAEEQDNPEVKAVNDRITLFVCINASGDYKSKPVVVYHAENPTALKGRRNSSLPVYWHSNKKGHFTGPLFDDWFERWFVPEVKRYLEDKKLSFKVLLLLGNIPGCPVSFMEGHSNVKVVFLEASVASLLQPLSQGIITTFKAYYFKKTLTHIINTMEEYPIQNEHQYSSEFTILTAIGIIEEAWDEISYSVVNDCWMSLWPEIINDFKGFPSIHEEVEKIVTLVNAIGGEGLSDFEEVQNLIESDKEGLTNKELEEMMASAIAASEESKKDENHQIPQLTSKGISEILKAAEFLKEKITQRDPHLERNMQIKRTIDEAMASYVHIYKTMENQRESPVRDIFMSSPTSSPQSSAGNSNS